MNKTVMITGSSSGIGKAAAIKFAKENWNVVATMRKPEKEDELIHSPNVLVTRLDVQQPATITHAMMEGIERFGQIDVLLNNAGYAQFGLFEATTPEQAMMQFDVNVFGVMNVTRIILPHLRQLQGGTILNVSSGTGRYALPLTSLYSASKFALEGFSEALYYELATQNIYVKIIEVGGTETNFSTLAAKLFASDPALTGYENFVEAATRMFGSIREAGLIDPWKVAEVIFQASTDGTDKFRYAVGNDDFKTRLRAREQLSDQEFLCLTRAAYTRFMRKD